MPARVWSKLFSARGQSAAVVLKLGEPPKEAGAAEIAGELEVLLPPRHVLCCGGCSGVCSSALECCLFAPTLKGQSAKTQLGQPASASSCSLHCAVPRAGRLHCAGKQVRCFRIT